MKDLTLLRDMMAVREAIALDPNSFDMKRWKLTGACGTALCLGGHLAVLRGIRFVTLREYAPMTHASSSDERREWLPKSFFESVGIPSDNWLWNVGDWPCDLCSEYHYGDEVLAGQKAIDLWVSENYTPEEIATAKTEYAPRLADLVEYKAKELAKV